MTRRWQYPEKVEPEFTGPEVTTPDKWFSPLSEPVRIIAVALVAGGMLDPLPPAAAEEVTADKWLVPLSEPVRNPVPQQQFRSPTPVVLEVPIPEEEGFGWYVQLAEPVLPERSVSGLQVTDPEALTRPEVTTPDKWFTPLSEPLFIKPPVYSGSIFDPEPIPDGPAETITLDKWHQPLSGPPLPGVVVHTGAEFDPEPIPGAPEDITLDKWYRPFSGPPLPPVPQQQIRSSVPVVLEIPESEPEVVPDLDWFSGLSEPQFPVFRPEGRSPVVAAFEVTEDVTVDKWLVPLSEPIFDKRVTDSGGLFHPEPQIDVEQLTPDKWLVALSVPVLPEHQTRPGSFLVDPDQLLQPEFVTSDKWFTPLSEPVLPKHQTRPGLSILDPEPLPDPEILTLDKWYVPLAEPVLPKVRIPEFPAYAESLEPISGIGPGPEQIEWFAGLSEPVLPTFNLARLVSGPFETVDILPEVLLGPDCVEYLSAPIDGDDVHLIARIEDVHFMRAVIRDDDLVLKSHMDDNDIVKKAVICDDS